MGLALGRTVWGLCRCLGCGGVGGEWARGLGNVWGKCGDIFCDVTTTQPTRGGAVGEDTSNGRNPTNCVNHSRPPQWGPDLPFFGQADHADPLHGWHCSYKKRAMSNQILVRQPNKSGFAMSVANKYM